MRKSLLAGLAFVASVGSTADASAQAAYGAAAKNATPPAPPSPGVMTGEAAPPAPKPEIKFNNEGTFKVSGSKGSGAVGGAKPKASSDAGKAKGAATGKGKVKETGNIAQWPGFRLTDDGGSEVMVEFSQTPTAPTEHVAAGSVTYVFKGAHVSKHNNQNPLLTVHFNTPVASARLVPKKGELHLVVDLRANATASSGLRASSDGDGQQFFVKFPSGTWLPKGAENDPMPPAPTQKLKAKGEGTPAKTAPATEPAGAKTGPNP